MIKNTNKFKKNNFLYNMKLNFDASSIKLRSIDSKTFLRGLEYYDDGAVFGLSISKTFNDESLEDIIKIKAKVGDPQSEPREIEISIDIHGDIVRYKCNCEDYKKHTYGYCKHLIAVLLYLYNNNKSSDIRTKTLSALMDSNCTNLIKYYENKMFNETKPEIKEDKIILFPKLLLNTQGFLELYFSIGTTKKSYVVKDIFSLSEHIRLSQNYIYGKNFEINHNINNFDDKSKSLAKLIVNLCYEYLEMYGYNMDLIPTKKSIKVPNSQLDLLFELFKNETLILTYDSENHELLFIDENPKLTFTIEKNYSTNKYEFSIKEFFEKKVHIMKFLNKSYIIYDDKFYKCSNEFNEIVLPAIDKIQLTRNLSISISEDNLSLFYSTVISRLELYAEIIIPSDVKDLFINYPLKAEVFLDTNKSKAIYAELIFSYGDIKLNALQKQVNKDNGIVIRNLQKEMEIITFLKNSGFVEKDKRFVLNNENQIYAFITTNVNTLLEMCEVNASESFQKIKLKNPKNISMGVKLSNNLIELDLENLEFSISELKDILKQYKVKKKYYRLKDGSFLMLNDNYFSIIQDMVSDLNLLNEPNEDNKIYIPNYRSLYIENLIHKSQLISAKKNNDFKCIVSNLNSIDKLNFDIPKSLDNILRQYQKTGFKWLKTLSYYRFGGILADDMGLGKTLQIITLLLSEKNENDSSISIVICPSSLIFNWVNEVEKFAPSLKIRSIIGNKEQRIELLKDIKGIDLLITSYDLLKRDIDIYKNLEFKFCILDEAQYIKNSYTLNAASVKCLNSSVRFALTGTPIENSLSDLWSIFDFIMPKFLLSYKNFKENYENPIIKDNDIDALNKLNEQIKPFILRRLKKDVLTELPDKIETSSYTKMDDKQKMLYTAELVKANEEFNIEISNQGYEKSQIKILSMLTRLRQICCHPSLYIENYTGESAKLNLCMQIVKDSISTGHKILIFSQFTTMLDIIAKNLSLEDIKYYVLTGSTKISERVKLIDDFNTNDIPVFLISLKAGGTGLNLTGADIVIHYDPWWNNSVQNQATDRAYRIGQKNKVQVFKLITKDTIEEKIENLQIRKQDLINSVITEKEVLFNSLSKEEIKSLFDL